LNLLAYGTLDGRLLRRVSGWSALGDFELNLNGSNSAEADVHAGHSIRMTCFSTSSTPRFGAAVERSATAVPAAKRRQQRLVKRFHG